jgi:hypothetical protein
MSNILIFDTSDNSNVFPNQQLFFYANYTNISSNLPIQGGGSFCNVTLQSNTYNMTYDAGLGIYRYNQTFSSAGVYPFNVSCFGAPLGFSNLYTLDNALVSPEGSFSVRGANVNSGVSETAPVDLAGNGSAFAGNVTQLTITGYSTTQSWQGYFGNVSGTIELADGGGDVLYNWSLANPEGEVFASVINIISWTNVMCFNFTARGNYSSETGGGGGTNLYGTNLSQLESAYSIASDDVDGVDETFNLLGAGTHDLFFIGSRQFSEGECRSTRVFDSTGTGVNNNFEEVLLYDPITRAVIFAAILEEQSLSGYDGGDHDFEMLVLEDGHGADVSATTYYFFVELE